MGARGYVTCYKTLGTCYLARYVPLAPVTTWDVMGVNDNMMEKRQRAD